MPAQLPMPIRPGQTFVQAVQANFDHLMGELHNIAESLNDLVTDQNLIKDLLGGTIDSSEELAGEYHDTIADATTEVIDSEHVGAADPHPVYETSPEAQAKVDTHAATPHGVSDHGALTGLGDDDHPQYDTSAEAQAKVDTHAATPHGSGSAASAGIDPVEGGTPSSTYLMEAFSGGSQAAHHFGTAAIEGGTP